MTSEPHRARSHGQLRELVGAYALGQLSGEQWRAVHDHLVVCAACRADLEEVAPVAGLLGVSRDRLRPDELGSAVAEGAPPLSPALLAEVAASGGGAEVVPLAPRRRRVRLLQVAAAAVVGLIAAGAIGYTVGERTVPRIPTEAVAVRAVNPAVQAQAALVAHTWGMEVKLTATGFEPGTPYTVTVTDAAGRTVSAGEFLGTGAEEMRCNLNSSVLRVDASTVEVRGPAGRLVLDAAV